MLVRRLAGLMSLLTVSGLIGAAGAAASDKVTLPRALYWNLRDGHMPATPDIVGYLRKLGISEVHVWLNEPSKIPDDLARQCKKFEYTSSKGDLVFWKSGDNLAQFAADLQAAKFKVVFTLSPHWQRPDYIEDLSAKGQPFEVARRFSDIDIEFDVEENWYDDQTQTPCGQGNAADMTKMLIDELRDLRKPEGQRKPLKLIVTTNTPTHHKMFLDAADVIAPQLYESTFGHKPNDMRNELVNTWFGYGKVFQAGLTSYRIPGDSPDDCSRPILDESIKAVAELSKCGNKTIIGFVIWSESTLRDQSTFGREYLTETANKPVTVSCDPR